MLTRRCFMAGSALVALGGCQPRRAETPLAHLYGKDWVHGTYAQYAKAYIDVEDRAQARTFESYKLLAQKGIAALDGLQAREVPFYIRVAPDAQSFRVEREVPERLTFTADMSATDREETTRAWKIAREHIQTDYEETRRLDWALGELLGQLSRVRMAIDQGQIEQFRVCRQLRTLAEGGELPFQLPYQVTRQDYETVLRLLLERLESDRERLRRSEASIIAVGLAARATDSGSASLAANVRKVLLAVVRDSDANRPPPAEFPAASDEKEQLLAKARKIEQRILASPEYQRWLAAELEKEDVIGQLLVVLDSMTGLPTSSVYRQVMRVWRGGGDYLDYLKIAAAIVPGGTDVSGVLGGAVETTERYRQIVQKSGDARALVKGAKDGQLELEGAALVNVGTRRAERQLGRQLAFYTSAAEAQQASEELNATVLAKSPLPALPR